MNSIDAARLGSWRNWKPAWKIPLAEAAVLVTWRQSSGVTAMGFSQYTFLPISSAAMAISLWKSTGVAMTTASISLRSSSLRYSVYGSGEWPAAAAWSMAALRLSGLISQMATTL